MDPRDTLERLVPEQVHPEDRAGAASLQLHRERYAFAARHARPGRLLDLACGVGFGAKLLAEQRADLREITAVDLSPAALAHAARHYACERIRWVQGDAMRFAEGPEARAPFDTVVSLETIEHLPDPVAFFAQLVGLLEPGGVLVASVPTTPSVDLNPHHLHDFSERSFRALGAEWKLEELAAELQVQRVGLRELWSGDRRFRRENLRPNLAAYYLAHPGALARRVGTTVSHGLANHYLTIAWQKT